MATAIDYSTSARNVILAAIATATRTATEALAAKDYESAAQAHNLAAAMIESLATLEEIWASSSAPTP
jgi:5-enolpyruvylshikimate-3-phosphate synthase